MKIFGIFELPVMADCVSSKLMGQLPLLADRVVWKNERESPV